MKDNSFFLEGDDRLVILLHAYTSSANDNYSIGRALNREGYSVYAPTLSGHAEDNMDDLLEYGASDWVQDGQNFVKEMQDKGYNEMAMFGLSLGGIISTKTLLDNDALIAAGSFCSPLYENGRGSNVAKEFEKSYKKTMPEESLTESSLNNMRQKLKINLETLNNLVNKEMTPRYPEITRPIFIAQGGKDTMIDPTIALEYRDQLVNADVSFHWYEDAAHFITVGRSGKAVQEDLIPFVNQLNWKRGNNE